MTHALTTERTSIILRASILSLLLLCVTLRLPESQVALSVDAIQLPYAIAAVSNHALVLALLLLACLTYLSHSRGNYREIRPHAAIYFLGLVAYNFPHSHLRTGYSLLQQV